jgi:hypothetical protein
MRAEREDRVSENETTEPTKPAPTKAIAAAAVIAVVVIAAWFLLGNEETTPAPVAVATSKPVAIELPTLPPAEDIPMRETVEPAPVVEPEVVLTDAEQNRMLNIALSAATENALFEQLLQSENLAERGTALVDGMKNGIILRKFLPIPAVKGPFSVATENEKIYMGTAGYSRYDSYAEAVANLNAEILINSFHQFRPFLEKIYGALGMASDDVDNAIIGGLDQIIATPELTEAIELELKSVMYTFADPRLEALGSLQKQLLRMGPDNIRLIKSKTTEIREGLLLQQ